MNDLIPPSDIDLEKIVLGTILSYPNTYYEISNIINKESFYNSKHKAIFDIIVRILESGKTLNIMTCFDVANRNYKSENLTAYEITTLTSDIFYKHESEVFVNSLLLKQLHVQRELLNHSFELQNRIRSNEDIEDLLTFADKSVVSIMENTIINSQTRHISDILNTCMVNIKERIKNAENNVLNGIDTGLKQLNKIIGGWKTGLIVIGARPAMGKTAFALLFARKAALQNKSVCIFSLEMGSASLTDRILIAASGVDAQDFRNGRLDKNDFYNIETAKSQLEKLPIYIDDKPVISVRYMRQIARKMKKQGRCDLIIIDYLQLVDASSDKKNRNREQEVSEVSRSLKLLSKEVDVPVILLAQLSRNVEQRGDKRPILSDLRESGAIEQDADIVAFIHRPEYYDKENMDIKGQSEFIVSKHREGSLGDVFCKNNESLTDIRDFDEVEEWAGVEFKTVRNEFF